MAIKRLIILTSLALFALATASDEASAQSYRRGHRPLRWLGQGFGDGFQRCNPGPNSDYYNPYSGHNSYLISQSPQFSGQLLNPEQVLLKRGIIRQGVPFSIYAAPQGHAPEIRRPQSESSDFQIHQGQLNFHK